MITNSYRSSCKVPVIIVRFLMKIELSSDLSENYSNTKFHINPSSESRAVPCGRTNGRTDRHDKVNNSF